MSSVDSFPASYRGVRHRDIGRGGKRVNHGVNVPGDSVDHFLSEELSLQKLEKVRKYLGLAGSKHAAGPLHYQISSGRNIVITERMDMHLLWAKDGRIFIKPMPRFLLDSGVWIQYLTCRSSCVCPESPDQKTSPSSECTQKQLRKRALGFLYTYACLISYESDFAIANDNGLRLLPRRNDGSEPRWEDWKRLVQEILESLIGEDIHERFYRGELRLSRLNTVHRIIQWPLFDPYFRTWRHYGDLFRENLTWLATATVFVALVLTAMQLGLAIDQLKANDAFMAAAYGFTVFAILGPLGVFGLVLFAALYNLLKDLPYLLGLTSKQSKEKDQSKAPSQVE